MLLQYPSYSTFTGKVILTIRGQLSHILSAIRGSWVHEHIGEAVRYLSRGDPHMLLNTGGLS